MDFYFFHLMPHHPLSENFDEYRSAWTVYPNEHFDRDRGATLYKEYIDQLVYAESIGFDGVCVNEHHQNAYGTMPNPNIIAGMLAMKTDRARIAILGNGLPIRDDPQRVAEEIAMLDLASDGRIIIGFVRGIGAEYFNLGINPAHSRERFEEAQELVLRAWTEPGPFEFHGKHYKFRHVNTWPLPKQTPHPPVWCPSTGSLETIEYAAHPDRRYPIILDYTSKDAIKGLADKYRQAAENYGYESSPSQLGWLIPVYVADTDKEAREEAGEHLLWLYNKGLYMPGQQVFPYGYISRRSYRPVMHAWDSLTSELDLDGLIEGGHALIGSPETVKQQIEELVGGGGFGIMAPVLQFGDMPHWKAIKNMELFGREVMRPLQQSTHAERLVSPWATNFEDGRGAAAPALVGS